MPPWAEAISPMVPRIRQVIAPSDPRLIHFSHIANSTCDELAMWEKWINLGSLGAITCLMRGTIGEIASAHGGIAYADGVIDECIAVAAAYGFAIRPDVVARAHASLTDPTSGLTSSMYRDLSAGRRTEADHII